jgi:hypothetical protein
LDRLELRSASSLQPSRIRQPQSESVRWHLYLAEVLDAGGNRQLAIANYKQVLSANFEDSHNTAQLI